MTPRFELLVDESNTNAVVVRDSLRDRNILVMGDDTDYTFEELKEYVNVLNGVRDVA